MTTVAPDAIILVGQRENNMDTATNNTLEVSMDKVNAAKAAERAARESL